MAAETAVAAIAPAAIIVSAADGHAIALFILEFNARGPFGTGFIGAWGHGAVAPSAR